MLRKGLGGREASRRLQFSAARGGRVRHIRCTGAATVAPMGISSGTGKFDADVGFLLELVRQDTDVTLFEFRDALADAEGVIIHHSAIATHLKHLGFT